MTVEVPGIGSTSTTDTSQGTVDAQLRDLLWTCGALVGRWEHEVEQQLEAIGFDEAIEGTLTLVREPQADDTEDALADLSAQLHPRWPRSTTPTQSAGPGRSASSPG